MNYFFNRDFEAGRDGWIHLVPKGEFLHQETGLVQVLDDLALDSIFHSFRNQRRPLLVDEDHFSYDSTKSTKALAWIKEIDRRPDGLWGRPEWTSAGTAAVGNRLYRYLSPTFLLGDVLSLGNNRVRPIRLDTVALTNGPNIKALQPLWNRRDNGAASNAGQPRAFGPEDASKLMLLLANRAQKMHSLSFVDAWSHLKQTDPALNLLARSGSPAHTLPNRRARSNPREAAAQAVAVQQVVRVRQTMANRHLTFTEAWNYERTKEPKLFLQMQEHFDSGDAKHQLDKIWNDTDRADNPYDLFWRKLAEIGQENPSFTFEELWAAVKKEHPEILDTFIRLARTR